MAKIDTTKIEGYDGMSAEEKLAALEGYEMPDADYSGYVRKDVFDKTASELANLKKTHNDLLSDDERKKAELDEEIKGLHEKVETLEKEKTVSAHKAKFIAMGYEEALATETAEAMADGNAEKVFENQQKFLEAYSKKLKADKFKDTPKPPAGDPDKGMTLEKFRKMSAEERLDFANNHPEEYKKLYGGNE